LLKKSDSMLALKGRGFQPRRKCSKMIGGFSRRGELLAQERLFPQLLGLVKAES
jgi:hypothetical protein